MRLSKVLTSFFICVWLLALFVGMMWQVGLNGVLESLQIMGLWIIPYSLLRSNSGGWRGLIDRSARSRYKQEMLKWYEKAIARKARPPGDRMEDDTDACSISRNVYR